MHRIPLLLLLTLSATPALASPADPSDAIRRLETAWNEAHLRGDVETLESLWADDLVIIVPGMSPMSKADALDMWRSVKVEFTRYETSDVQVHVHGDVAVATGRVDRARSFRDRVADDQWLFTKTYARRDGSWKVVSYHASATPAQAAQPQPSASQNPSPMVESTRTHGRIEKSEPEGTRWTLRAGEREVPLFLPKRAADADAVDLIVHFHGAAWLAEMSAAGVDRPVAIATMHAGAGSRAYASAFRSPEAFESLLAAAAEALAPRKIGGIWLTGFSAGHGAIRSILDQPAGEKVRGILLLDGLHTGYVPDRKVLADGGALDATNLAPFARFAREAAEGKKRMVVTHSEIFPGTFASTTETADWLIRELGLARAPVLVAGPVGMQQLSEVHKGNLHILGFAGNSAPDHVDHFHGMPEFLAMLMKP